MPCTEGQIKGSSYTFSYGMFMTIQKTLAKISFFKISKTTGLMFWLKIAIIVLFKRIQQNWCQECQNVQGKAHWACVYLIRCTLNNWKCLSYWGWKCPHQDWERSGVNSECQSVYRGKGTLPPSDLGENNTPMLSGQMSKNVFRNAGNVASGTIMLIFSELWYLSWNLSQVLP